ncbi:poly-beta-1,6-N-acetyl-D-glucosamine biosynthesis protein PgaD [Clostridium sp. MB05]|uniref:poly-beta-1,6-N-acetyl-D-glucosamine biosynthesis protein PgaD n=1 Tax=Clostridium sp. MB05 TaxID=3376682 RepID=UPI0039819539
MNNFIIKSKQNPFKKLLTIILTLVMWIYSIVVFYFFISAVFNENDKYISAVKEALKMTNNDINGFLIIVFLLLIMSFLILIIWRTYNKKKFGKLNRRVYPKNTTKEEMLSLNLISEKNFNKLQEHGVLIFEENPIKELERGKKLEKKK